MKTIKYLYVLFLVASCASTQQQTGEPSDALQAIVSEKTFTIFSDRANPQYGRAFSQLSSLGFNQANTIGTRIDISGNTNYLTFKNDSVFGRFPYFGERQMGSSYSNIDQGISFKGVPEDLEIVEAGSTYKMTFKIKDSKARNEKYEVLIKLNSKLRSIIDISSTHRNSISYEGQLDTSL